MKVLRSFFTVFEPSLLAARSWKNLSRTRWRHIERQLPFREPLGVIAGSAWTSFSLSAGPLRVSPVRYCWAGALRLPPQLAVTVRPEANTLDDEKPTASCTT